MANVNITTYPTEYDIKPANNFNIFGFNSESGTVPFNAVAVFYFSQSPSTLPYTTAVAGDYIEVNGNRIYFSDNPKFAELTSTALSTLYDSTLELFQILSQNPTLKNTYDFGIIDDGGGFYHVIMISKKESSLFDITINVSSGISDFFYSFIGGYSGTRGGDLLNWGVYVDLYALFGSDRTMLNDNVAIGGFNSDSEKITLLKNWQGLNPDLTETEIKLDFSGFLKDFVESIDPFSINNFEAVKTALVRYYANYGEFYGTNQRKYPIDSIGITYALYAHIAGLLDVVYIGTEFEKYWKRTETLGVFPALTVSLLTWLRLQPESYKYDVNQMVFGSFILKYYRFDQTEAPNTYLPVDLSLQYDLYFEDGTSLLNQSLLGSNETVNYFTHYIVDLSPYRLDLFTIENSQGSKVEKVVWRVLEDNGVVQRVATEDFIMNLDNELRDFNVNDAKELIFLNSLGNFDTVLIHNEVITEIAVQTDIYSKTITEVSELNSEVFRVDTTKVLRIKTDPILREIYTYLGTELLRSKKIYFGGERVSILSSDYSDASFNDLKELNLQLNPLLKK